MKKIMFNDKYGLTQAVLEGRKTQTRRIVKIPENATGCEIITIQRQHREYVSCERLLAIHTESHIGVTVKIPYQVEDEVAIAQSYKDCTKQCIKETGLNVKTKEDLVHSKGYNNKMFARADYMPYRIKITKIRVERLQDISDKDCLKEGIECKNERYVVQTYKGVVFYTTDVKLAYKYLIDKICGRGTWDSNPYVFVYDFELVK